MASSSDLRIVYSQFLLLTVSGFPAYGPGSHVTSETVASNQSEFIQTVTLSGIVLTVIIFLLALCVRGRKEEANDGVQDVYAVPNKQAKKNPNVTKKQRARARKQEMMVNALYTEYKESKKVSRKVQKAKKGKQKKTEAVYENVEQNTDNTAERVQDVYAKPNKKAKKKTKRTQERQTAQTYENVEI